MALLLPGGARRLGGDRDGGARELLLELEHAGEEIARLRETRAHVADREGVRATERGDLVPFQWGRHRRAADRPDAVRTGGGLPADVLQIVDVHATPATLDRLRRHQLRLLLACGLADIEDEAARLFERVAPRDRHVDVDAARSRGLRKSTQAEVVEHAVHELGRLLHVVPGRADGWV